MKKAVKNKYKAPKKLWAGFGSANAKQAFNNVMDKTIKDQPNIVHPKTKLPNSQWFTICWNFACMAAWEIRDIDKEV